MGNGMTGIHSPVAGKDEWLTPQWLVQELGEFDLDPCAPVVRPWDTAKRHLTAEDDGLKQQWSGRVWLNPPYGLAATQWLSKLADHGDGIALIFARTETEMFFKQVWGKADAVLFLRGRLVFHHVTGEAAEHNSGAPSVLVAYGDRNVQALTDCAGLGKFIRLTS